MSFTRLSEGEELLTVAMTETCGERLTNPVRQLQPGSLGGEGRERSPHPKGEQRQAVLASGQTTALQTPNQLWVLVKQ